MLCRVVAQMPSLHERPAYIQDLSGSQSLEPAAKPEFGPDILVGMIGLAYTPNRLPNLKTFPVLC